MNSNLPLKPIPQLPEKAFLGLDHLQASRRDPLGFFRQVVAQCGDIGSYRVGLTKIIMLNSPELIHEFLVERAEDFDKGRLQRYAFRPLGGNGLFTSEGQFHQVQRKLLAPCFQPRILAKYADTIASYTERYQAKWTGSSSGKGEVMDLEQAMMALTMSIICKVMLGAEIEHQTEELGQAINQVAEWIQHTMTHFTPPLWVPTQRNRRTNQALVLLKQRLGAIIQARRNSQGPDNQDDLLSLLLAARYEDGSGMSDQQVYDEILTIFGAGHATTALALTWAFYLLMQHPHSYSQLAMESSWVVAGRLPTYTDLPQLPYATQVFKEALRIYPPSAIILRTALRDTQIGGHAIHKGQIVTFSQYTLHRREDTFPNPEQFEPERFSAYKEAKLPRYAYLPFGAGPRICIGNHFALLEGPLILATLAQKVHFELAEGQPEVNPQLVVNLRPEHGLKVRVYPI